MMKENPTTGQIQQTNAPGKGNKSRGCKNVCKVKRSKS